MRHGVSNGQVTDDVTWPRKHWPQKVKLVTPNTLSAQYISKQLDMLFSNNC